VRRVSGPERMARAVGAVVGAAVGDALGAPFEFGAAGAFSANYPPGDASPSEMGVPLDLVRNRWCREWLSSATERGMR